MNHQILPVTLTPKRSRFFRRMWRLTSSKASRREAQPALENADQRGLGHSPNKHFATQKVILYRRKHCLLALRTVKLPFQSSRVIFLGRSPAEEHLTAVMPSEAMYEKEETHLWGAALSMWNQSGKDAIWIFLALQILYRGKPHAHHDYGLL